MSAQPREPSDGVVWMIRHADAGDRLAWSGAPDSERPLSRRGHAQSAALVVLLASGRPRDGVRRVLSSPYVRCVETVDPLAAALGVTVEPEDDLAEGTPLDRALELIARSPGAAMCSHGDVIADLVMWLEEHGRLGRNDVAWKKASTWILRLSGGEIRAADYLPPPRVRD